MEYLQSYMVSPLNRDPSHHPTWPTWLAPAAWPHPPATGCRSRPANPPGFDHYRCGKIARKNNMNLKKLVSMGISGT